MQSASGLIPPFAELRAHLSHLTRQHSIGKSRPLCAARRFGPALSFRCREDPRKSLTGAGRFRSALSAAFLHRADAPGLRNQRVCADEHVQRAERLTMVRTGGLWVRRVPFLEFLRLRHPTAIRARTRRAEPLAASRGGHPPPAEDYELSVPTVQLPDETSACGGQVACPI